MKKLIDNTTPEFEEYISGPPLNIEYDWKEVFEQFKKEFEDFAQLRQLTFTKWIKTYCEPCNLEFFERRSGQDRFIKFLVKA